jgi:hypothetical protein
MRYVWFGLIATWLTSNTAFAQVIFDSYSTIPTYKSTYSLPQMIEPPTETTNESPAESATESPTETATETEACNPATDSCAPSCEDASVNKLGAFRDRECKGFCGGILVGNFWDWDVAVTCKNAQGVVIPNGVEHDDDGYQSGYCVTGESTALAAATCTVKATWTCSLDTSKTKTETKEYTYTPSQNCNCECPFPAENPDRVDSFCGFSARIYLNCEELTSDKCDTAKYTEGIITHHEPPKPVCDGTEEDGTTFRCVTNNDGGCRLQAQASPYKNYTMRYINNCKDIPRETCGSGVCGVRAETGGTQWMLPGFSYNCTTTTPQDPVESFLRLIRSRRLAAR